MATALAQAPVAVVEEVTGKPSGVEFMDYVLPGKVIKLGPKDSIVLGYMKSCWREMITGGTVLVGAEQSMVHEGEIERVKVDCDKTGQHAADQDTRESAATVFRGMVIARGNLAASDDLRPIADLRSQRSWEAGDRAPG